MASENDIEADVAEVWSQTLTNFSIGPEDNFFDLGGDSLQMMDMLFTLSKRFGTDIEPQMLFEDASLRGFSILVAQKIAAAAPLREDLD